MKFARNIFALGCMATCPSAVRIPFDAPGAVPDPDPAQGVCSPAMCSSGCPSGQGVCCRGVCYCCNNGQCPQC